MGRTVENSIEMYDDYVIW